MNTETHKINPQDYIKCLKENRGPSSLEHYYERIRTLKQEGTYNRADFAGELKSDYQSMYDITPKGLRNLLGSGIPWNTVAEYLEQPRDLPELYHKRLKEASDDEIDDLIEEIYAHGFADGKAAYE